MTTKHILLLILPLFIFSCDEEDFVVNGMSPVYHDYNDFSSIESLGPQPVVELGKIITRGDYVFVNDVLQGIHVVDNTIPSSPEYKYFWKIIGNREFTITDNTLYADNGKHLLVIDITDFSNIIYVDHIPDFYNPEDHNLTYRPNEGYVGYFTCVEVEKGIVVDWEQKTLTNPTCEAY